MAVPAFEGSAAGWGCELHSDVMVLMRDGVRLATDIYLPAVEPPGVLLPAQFRQRNGTAAADLRAPGPGFPCVLMRTPYDKSLSHKLGTFFARRG